MRDEYRIKVSFLFLLLPACVRLPFARFGIAAICLLTMALLSGCESTPSGPTPTPPPNDNNPPPTARVSDCLGCHTDEAMLKLVAREEPPAVEDSGEG